MRSLILLAPCLIVFTLAVSPGTSWSQADTVPVVLQMKIVAGNPRAGITNTLEYCPTGTVLASGNFLYISTDGGRTFHTFDTSFAHRTYYSLAHEDRALYRLFITDSNPYYYWFQISWDLGRHWGVSEGLYTAFNPDNIDFAVDPAGDKLALLSDTSIDSAPYSLGAMHLASDFGASGWNTRYMDSTGLVWAWADQDYGVIPKEGRYRFQLLLSSDGGGSWNPIVSSHVQDSILNSIQGITHLSYPFTGIIIATGSGTAISRDTGKTWVRDDSLYDPPIDFVQPDEWFRPYGSNTPQPMLSTDSGRTWRIRDTLAAYYARSISFKDSLRGLASNGYDLVASTSDGGYHWQTLDSSDYMFGIIAPSPGSDSAYYSFSPYRDGQGNGAFAFYTWNRGVTWKRILTNGSGYAFAGLDSAFWLGGTGYVQIASIGAGGAVSFPLSSHDSTRITTVDKNFVWVSNGNELHAASNSGANASWGPNKAVIIPGYDTSNSYRFFAIDRNVVYVRASDTVYRTNDGGSAWSVAPAMPARVLDAQHWFQFTSDTSSLNYTTDAGQSFRTISVPNGNARTIFPVDTARWYVNGFYTRDAGSTWQRIPGWDNNLGLYVVDPSTAFGQPFGSNLYNPQPLWRLDLPLAGSAARGIVESPAAPSGFSIYPNPTTGLVTMSGALGSIEVENVLGERVIVPGARSPESGTRTLDLSKLPAGTYFVRVQRGDAVAIERVVKRQ